jgi:RNase P/RNase MRP subunit POP5
VKLTDRSVASLVRSTKKGDYVEWDDDLPGFGIRLRGDSKRWIVQYRIGPQQRREILGDVRKVRAEAARKAARQRFAQIELGIDPGAVKAKARMAATAAQLTLTVVSERYLDAKKTRLRPSSYQDAKRYFTNHWASLRDRPIEAIRRADVAAGLQEIIKAHGPVSAARASKSVGTIQLVDARGPVRCQSGHCHQ